MAAERGDGVRWLRYRPGVLWLAMFLLAFSAQALGVDEGNLQVEVQRVANGFAVHAVFPVAVTPTRAFAVMTDYGHMTQFIPQMHKSQVLWRDGAHESVLQEGSINLLWLRIPTFVVMSVHRLSDRAVRFHSTGGSMAIRGQADVRASADGSVVEYRATLEPQTLVPMGLAQNLVARYIRQQMEALRAEMLRVG